MARMSKSEAQRAFPNLASELDSIPEPEARKKKVTAEDIFATQCRVFGLPDTRTQYRFETELRSEKSGRLRQWKFDFAWPQYMLAVEIDGVVMRRMQGFDKKWRWVATGGHSDIQGMRDNNKKINRAIETGWSVLRYLEEEVQPGRAIQQTMRVLALRGWKR